MTGAEIAGDVLSTRATEAPASPGVYFILGAQNELVYIGKAANLSRRLRDHARTKDTSREWRKIPSSIHEVRWIECANDAEAACREADLIVALAPTFNKTMTVNDTFMYIAVERMPSAAGGKLRFRLTDKPDGAGSTAYGVFPQLGKGKVSWPAVRSNAGYAALLRLIWVACSTGEMMSRMPSRLHGSSPPVDHATPFDRSLGRPLRDFLSGRSQRLVNALRERAMSPEAIAYMRPSLEKDLESARRFFELGPRSLRALRLRNQLPPGTIDRDTFTTMLRREVQETVGDFVSPRGRNDRHFARITRTVELRKARDRLAQL